MLSTYSDLDRSLGWKRSGKSPIKVHNWKLGWLEILLKNFFF